MTDNVNAIIRLNSVNAKKAKCMYALVSRPINKRSPRVVLIGKKPLRSVQGTLISYTVMHINITAITLKNETVNSVHAIQLIIYLLKCLTHVPRQNPWLHGFVQSKSPKYQGLWLRYQRLIVSPSQYPQHPLFGS